MKNTSHDDNKTSHDYNKKRKGKSKCAGCMTNKLFFDKIKHKIELEIFVSQFLSYKTKHANLLCEV